jgi:hypothetical protein
MVTGTQPAPATDYTGLFEGLKIIFEEPIQNALVQDTEVFDIFEQDVGVGVQQTNGGRFIELAHYAADGGGFGARREGGALPKSTAPSIFNGRINLRKNHMTVEMSGETMRRVKQGEASWITWAKDALPNATRRLKHHLDRQAIGYGQGILGRVSAIAGTTLTIDRSFGLTGLTGAIFQFMRNDLLKAVTSVDGTTVRAGEMKVLSVNPRLSQIKVDAIATGLIVGDFLTVGDDGGNSTPGGVSNAPQEMMGLLGIVDDGSVLATFQNQPRTGVSAVEEYKAQVVDAATAIVPANAFREELLIQADDDAFTFGGGQPDIILGHRAHEKAYWKDLKSDRQITDTRGLTDAGGKNRGFTINLNGRPVNFRVGRKLPDTLAFMLEKATFKKWQHGGGFEFDTTTGSIFERVVTGNARFDAYYAVGTAEAELGNVAPLRNVVIKNINPTV